MKDQSTARQYAEGVSPLTQVREYPMTEHTPGPWYSFIRPTTQTFAVFGPENDPRKPVVEWVGFDATITELGAKKVEANANRIAAAPDLLQSLESLLDIATTAIKNGDWQVDGACDPDAEIFRASRIAKQARGENHD